MLSLVLKRTFSLVLTLAIVSLVIFIAMSVLPGDPAQAMLGTSATDETLKALRESMGLDRPLIVRYFSWIAGVLKGDFGLSYTYKVPVSELIRERLYVTVPLAILSLLLAIAIAIPLGVTSAARKNSTYDYVTGVLSQAFIAMPAFWVGLLLVNLFALRLGWVPAGGFPGWSNGVGASLKALILPMVALALPQASVLTRVTRSSVLEVMNEDFVRTARAKGLRRNEALWRHAVPNALIPVITIIGLQFTFLIAGAIVVENVFSLPGLGRLAYQSLVQRDLIVMQSVVLFFSALVIVMNFIVDLGYLLLDPRLRAGAS